jgi:hypothetical protein
LLLHVGIVSKLTKARFLGSPGSASSSRRRHARDRLLGAGSMRAGTSSGARTILPRDLKLPGRSHASSACRSSWVRDIPSTPASGTSSASEAPANPPFPGHLR